MNEEDNNADGNNEQSLDIQTESVEVKEEFKVTEDTQQQPHIKSNELLDDSSANINNTSQIHAEEDPAASSVSLNLEGGHITPAEHEVINLLLGQHNILPQSTQLASSSELNDQPELVMTASTLMTANQSEESREEVYTYPKPTTPASDSELKEKTTESIEKIDDDVLPTMVVKETNDGISDHTHIETQTYLTSVSAAEIGNQLAGATGFEVLVAEDGQGGHIIISGGHGYQDGSTVVSLAGQSVVEGGLVSLNDQDNSSISVTGLGDFSSTTIQMTPVSSADGSPATALQYVLHQNSTDMSDQDSQLDSSSQTTPKKVYQCSIDGCEKQFSTPYRLKAHGRSHTGQTFHCDENGCKKAFITPSDLHKHVKTHSGEKPFVCEESGCGKLYTTAHHLKVHKRSHTGDKPFTCEWDMCGKSFSTGYGLKSHYRTHTGERPYKCPEQECFKAFKTSGDLQKHVRTHTGERPFKCLYDSCTRSFTTSNIRKVHMRTHSGERPYVCEIEGCGRSFASATNFKNHSRIHTGERPYVCEVPGCNKRFTEYSSLYKHNVVHTQQKPYTCNLCQKTYRQTSTLAMHKRTVHGGDNSQDSVVTENERTDEPQDGSEPPDKRQRITFDSNTVATALVQGLPVMLNDESAVAALQSQYAELAQQQLGGDGTSSLGAIAIPIQVTMNPDGTIAGAQGINITDSNGRIIPVSLSVSLPISSLGISSLPESGQPANVSSSEGDATAAAAAAAVSQIYSNQQSNSVLEGQFITGQVISDDVGGQDMNKDNSQEIQLGEKSDSERQIDGRQQIVVSEGLNNQILITTVGNPPGSGISESESTTIRIAPRDFTQQSEFNEAGQELSSPKDMDMIHATESKEMKKLDSESQSDDISGSGIDQDEPDVTEQYLTKDS